MRAFGYRFPGFVVEHGPVEARSLAEAKTRIRQRLGLSRLPWGFQVWDLSQRPLKAWAMRPSA